MQKGMDDASFLAMKALWTALVVLLAGGVAYVLVDRLQPLPEAPVDALHGMPFDQAVVMPFE